MEKISYQNYVAEVEFDPYWGCFVGYILNFRPTKRIYGRTPAELQEALEAAIDGIIHVGKGRGGYGEAA